MMADLVLQENHGFLGGEEKSGRQLIKPATSNAHWKPPNQAYLETSLDDLSYSSDDNNNNSLSPSPASSPTPIQITHQPPNDFLPNDHNHDNPTAEPGSRQSADEAVERRLMEQIQSEQEAAARHQIKQEQEQEQRHHLLLMQNQPQRDPQQLLAHHRQQVKPGELANQQLPSSRRQFQQPGQPCNTFGRPIQQPNEDQPPAVPVRGSSQAANRRRGHPIQQQQQQLCGSRPTRNLGTSFRRPSRSPPPPPVLPPLHQSTLPPPAPPKQVSQQATLRLSRRLWSPPESVSSCIGSPVSYDSSLNNLNALASNSTSELARTLADCSTPSPQRTVVEGSAQRELNQPIGGGSSPVIGQQTVVAAQGTDDPEQTQLECGLSTEPQPPPLASTGGLSKPLKQKPAFAMAGESCSIGSRSRSVVSLQKLSSAGLTNESQPAIELGLAPSRRPRQQQQQPMRSFSIAAPPCLAGSQLDTHQQVVACCSDYEQTDEQALLKSEPKYSTLPARQQQETGEPTRDSQSSGYALVDRSRKLSAPPTGKIASDLPLTGHATKSGPRESFDGAQLIPQDEQENNAIAQGEQDPFPAQLYESCSPPATTCATNLCQFRTDGARPGNLAIALTPSDQEQLLLMRMGDARQQERHQPNSRLQDEWLRSMYKQMHRPSAENRHLKAVNSAQHQQQELPVRIQLKGDPSTAFPPTYSTNSESDSFDPPFDTQRPSDSPLSSSGTGTDHHSPTETSHDRNLTLYYKLIKHIDHAFSSVLTDANSRSSHTLQAPRRSCFSKLQRNMSKSGPQTPVAGRSSNDQSSSIRLGGANWTQMSAEQHNRRCVFSQLLKDDLTTTTTVATKLPLKDIRDPLTDEADQHKQYVAVQAGRDIPLRGLRKPAPPNGSQKDHMFSDESVHIHYRTPTGKLLKMNTLNEFELNRLKKLYGKQEATSHPIERSKSGWLSSAHPATSSGPQHCKGGTHEDISVSPFVDLHRYQRAFLQASRAGSKGRLGAGTSSDQVGSRAVRFGRALFDFQAKSSGELSLRRGDLVELVEVIDHAWAKVEDCQSGLRGLAPLNYIDYNVGCAVAKRDVRQHSGPTRLISTIANEPPYGQHLLPMNKGEPITLIRRLSGHLYEASNTRQALGLVWSRDLDIIKQPVLGPDTGPQQTTPDTYCYSTRAKYEDELQDDEEMLILESGEQFLAKRRRACSASGRPSNSGLGSASAQDRQDCCCNWDYCNTSTRALLADSRPPPRSSSSPYISRLQQQTPVSPVRGHKLPQLHRAKYAYQPRQKDELELVAGDLLLVMHTCDDGWFIGISYSTNQMGTFPGNFVEPV